MPDDRSDRSHSRPGDHRPPFAGPRPPFRPPGRFEPAAPMVHTVRLRDGDRELEVSGSAVFVRQLLDDLASLWPRLHGEGHSRPAHISMPPPPAREATATATVAATPATPAPHAPHAPHATLDDRIFSVLKEAARPLAVAAIRKRLARR